jgi:ATP-binding cassette subfamily C protein CydCD
LLLLVIAAPIAASGQFNVVYLPLIALAAVMAFLPVIEVADVGRQLSDTLAATKRLMQVEQSQAVVTDSGTQVLDLSNSRGRAESLSIHFENIHFSYPPLLDEQVINAMNLTIKAGSKVALVGASGAGKSTIAHLLMRFWDPQQGGIFLVNQNDNTGTNKVNINQMKLESFRKYVSIVAQDTYLFNDTIRENLLMAKPAATEQQVLAAIESAQMADFILSAPLGLDTVVGERGFSLSGGQRQRLSIARAFLRDAPILILDEATSHLDAISEAAVHAALAQLMQNRTTLVIAHRLASIEDADKIVLLDQGRILEEGTHQQLLNNNGRYAALLRYQNVLLAA